MSLIRVVSKNTWWTQAIIVKTGFSVVYLYPYITNYDAFDCLSMS